MKDFALSPYARRSREPSPVNRMMTDFSATYRSGVDVNLGVGYVNEETIPARRILEAMEHVVTNTDHHDKPLNYGGAQGSANLIRSIEDYLVREQVGGITGQVLDRCDMVIGASGASSILGALGHLLEPGIVFTTDPLYYIYCDYLIRMGFEIIAVPEDEKGMRVDLLTQKLEALGQERSRVRFVYVVTVSNPTSTLMDNGRRKELLQVVGNAFEHEPHAVPVIFDTAYESLIHDPKCEKPVSGLVYDTSGIAFETGTLSKILAPALRIGYILGPPGPLIDALVQNVSDIGFSAPLVMQEAASHLLDNHLSEQVHAVNRRYREKALAVTGWIKEFLGEEVVECRGGSAGFYFYLTFRNVITEEGGAFHRFLSRTTGSNALDYSKGAPGVRVLYLPGTCCVHDKGDLVERGRYQLRISYGYENLDQIREGIRLMAEALAYASSRP